MKPLFAFFVILLITAFFASAALSISFLLGLNPAWNFPQITTVFPLKPDKPYVAVLLPNTRESFLQDLLEGIYNQAKISDIDIEVARYGIAEGSASLNLERLTLARVAGVLLLPPEDPKILAAIDQAESKGIPVILMQNDVPQSRRRVYIGPSPYQTGLEAARLIRLLKLNTIHVGLLLSQADQRNQTVQTSLFVNGISDGLASTSQRLDLDERISPPGRFAGEELVWQIIHDDPQLNVLVTTTPKDSLSALQTVVEANRVSKINLIAVGEDLELKEALKQGVLKGLILRDPILWGEQALTAMASVLRGENVSSYISLSVRGYQPGAVLP